MPKQLLQQEKFTSIQAAQAGLTRLFALAEKNHTFYRVLRGSKPVGVLLPTTTWESLVEDLIALSSPRYLASIATSRKSRLVYRAADVKRKLRLAKP